MAEHAIAVLVDFENMARPGAKSRGDFDINLVLNRLAEKGRVLVKRAYADWGRYREAKVDLQNAGLELIEMPSAREGAKNRADIKLAVDAMELAYSRDHLDNFVIVSGDSDFTPLVGKLRELNKRVTGMGNKESASELLIANCDEFIFYDTIAATAGGRTVRRGGRAPADPVALLQETLTALAREGIEAPLSSVVKDSIRRKHPAFDEADHGYGTFSKFLEEAAKKGIVRLETDPRSGTYRVEMADGTAAPAAAPSSAASAPDEPRENGETRRRRRRRRPEGAGASSEAPAADGGEVFEFVVTPRSEPQPDLSDLPPIDQPISYEDMILLGPEIGEDVPDLAEATDTAASEAPPARGSRRRRRRGAEAEPTAADLEPVDAELAAEVVAEAELLATVELAEEVAEVLAEEAVAEAVAEVLVEEALIEAATDPEPATTASRRRIRRGSTRAAAEAPAPEPEAEAEEAPKPRRRTRARKAADPEPAAEVVETPAPEPEAEEAPKPRRRTRARKAAEPEAAAETVEAPAAEAEEAPKPRRRTRARKAAEEVPAEV